LLLVAVSYTVRTSSARPGLAGTVQEGTIAMPDGKLLWAGAAGVQQELFVLTPAFFIDDRSAGKCAQYGSCSGALILSGPSTDGRQSNVFDAAGRKTQRFNFVFKRGSSRFVEELHTKLDNAQLGILVGSAVISLFGAARVAFTILEPRALVLFGAGKPGPPAEKEQVSQANPMHDRATDAMAQKVEQLLKDVGSMKATIATLEHRLAENENENGAIAIAAV
jgi:hypothetical protein